MGEKLLQSLRDAPVVKKGDYDYFVHPLTDGVPAIDPDLLREVCHEIIELADCDADKILTAEAMGIPLGTALSLASGLPLSIIRKRPYGLPGEIAVEQETGYSKGMLYINGLKRGDRVLLVDDVVSTGGTLLAIAEALEKAGVEVCDIVVIFEKGPGKEALEKRFGRQIKTLLRIDVRNGRVEPV
ncbi:MAG TPA: hypoxanthine/guanine phosphoribosyltransferase [Candidatus Thermoplasmatota archaeon]|nr:hypoxanthine/guanine phosphoribosyltransferase [Candidatus Thermoplasmatota archaeon]